MLNVCDGWIQERGAFYIRQVDFSESDPVGWKPAIGWWPETGAVLRKMFNIVDKLINNWEDFNAEIAKNTTLENKAMLVPMMYMPWELCDEILTH